ncbi:hybrid sensor histidine kinase/response regulator [Pedosphaera parvula]|uniref:histidine kinase n=1 Tax=Pedosphaera parvula (strain Ellin514) TaxID=320771 RepID=B9XNN3_PEDPL|nr:hybrid sensor histidine kinase/response regulator [Pedosphaera parvula]EEF58573.1 CheA signal transduction histidine kinase [Pedosphaera parvula Ellin514]
MSKDFNSKDLSRLSMLEIFQVETENQTNILTTGLLELERNPTAALPLESLMRAAHSLKGAARIVNLKAAVQVAHAMEDCFVAAQKGNIYLAKEGIDVLFKAVDLFLRLSKLPEQDQAIKKTVVSGEITALLSDLGGLIQHQNFSEGREMTGNVSLPSASNHQQNFPSSLKSADSEAIAPTPFNRIQNPERVLRLTAENLNRLLGLAGESLVESRWLHPFAESMRRLKRLQSELGESLDGLRETLGAYETSERVGDQMGQALDRLIECRQFLSDRLGDLEMFDRRSTSLSHRLYLEVLQCRMRPFGEGVQRFPRMMRDLAHSLGKEVKLEVIGEHTQVDRDILEKLETPLAHLLRNAMDHGCEMPEKRRAAGKPVEGTIRLEARHSSGMLMVIIADDGPGISLNDLRERVVEKSLVARDVANKLSEAELLQFLLLPGFSMKDTVTEISGRGVGLDVVQNTVKNLRGTIRISTQPNKGTRFQLQLPLTLSVIRTLLVRIGGESYGLPLSQITRALKLPSSKVERLQGRHYFTVGDQQISLVTAHQLLECAPPNSFDDQLSIVVIGDRTTKYGLVVEALLGERELVVQPLDQRLGKIKDVAAGAVMEDGSPVLILDTEDLMRSLEKLIGAGELNSIQNSTIEIENKRIKRILAVDDSMTVLEVERRLLMNHGYFADIAVDGMDGWNAVRNGDYDLVITDVDMPRMDGIELATLIKKDPLLKSIPVMIVSYKDREEDRLRGLEAGADYYLTKGSFHDKTLIHAVVDLIGKAEE